MTNSITHQATEGVEVPRATMEVLLAHQVKMRGIVDRLRDHPEGLAGSRDLSLRSSQVDEDVATIALPWLEEVIELRAKLAEVAAERDKAVAFTQRTAEANQPI